MTRWIGIAVAVLAAIGGMVWIAGSRIPREHQATAAAAVGAPPPAVFSRITDVEKYPSWRSDVKSVSVERPDRHIEESSFGKIPMRTVQRETNRLLVTAIDDEALGFGGTWTFLIEPDGTGTRVRITEQGWVENPLFRIVQKYVFGYDTTMKTYLMDLQKSFAPKS